MTIVFFDGECTLCNFFVDFLIRHDSKKQLKYASLQGETARQLIPHLSKPPYASVVLVSDGVAQTESTAALEALAKLGGAWQLMTIFKIIPPLIRDTAYRYTAKNRYKWFGKKESCRLPTPDERSYFLP